jgi:hypothetical protein
VRCSLLTKPIKKSHKEGQAVIEFVLLATIVSAIILGVFWPAFDRFTQGVKDNLLGDLRSVLSQTRVGIPINWFGLEDYAFNPPAPPSSVQNSDTPSGKDSDSDKGPTGGKLGGGDTPISKDTDSNPSSNKGANPNSSNLDNSAENNSSEESGSKKSKRSKNSEQAENSNQNSSVSKTNRGGDVNGEGNLEDDDSDSAKESQAEAKEKEASSGEVEQGQKNLLGRKKNQGQGGSCQDMDLLTLIKIFIILAILVLGAAVLLSAKGQKGDK